MLKLNAANLMRFVVMDSSSYCDLVQKVGCLPSLAHENPALS
jgi:hypothetical protein